MDNTAKDQTVQGKIRQKYKKDAEQFFRRPFCISKIAALYQTLSKRNVRTLPQNFGMLSHSKVGRYRDTHAKQLRSPGCVLVQALPGQA